MKAVVYRAPGQVEVAEVPKPRIEQSTDAVVRVTTASICGSDLHIYHGLLANMDGMIVGHEFVGTIDETIHAPMGAISSVRVRDKMKGAVDDVRVYRRAFTALDARSLYRGYR